MKTAMSTISVSALRFVWIGKSGRKGTSMARVGLRGRSSGEGDAEARMAIWSMNAAAVNCWRAAICVFVGDGSPRERFVPRRVGLLLRTMLMSWKQRLLASLRAFGERNISLQKSSFDGACA